MNDDMRQKRATFIGRSTEVRETFGFAQPNQIIQAVQTYCFDMYGAMTWPLYSQRAKQVFNTWSTCVKLAWGVPRATHTYLVDNFLSGGIPSIRASVLARYSKFVNSVRSSQSLEVRVVASIASADIRSTTGSNLFNLEQEAGMKLTMDTMWEMRRVLLNIKTPVPKQDSWRVGCLRKFMSDRHSMQVLGQDTEDLQEVINSLCET